MTLPREVIPGRIYMITRRCSEQRFLLRPDPITNNVFEYCLTVAKKAFHITVITHTMMSNHYHLVIYDRYGNYPAFLAYFHSLVARMMNTRWKRKDHFWSAAQTSVVHLPDIETLLDKLAYTITNPIKHGLVASISSWPGANGYRALMSRTPIRTVRPHFFCSEGTNLAANEELVLELPPVIRNQDAFRARLAQAVEQRVRELVEARAVTCKPFLGRAAVKQQHWSYRPEGEQLFTKATRNRIRPTFASKDVERRKEMIAMRRAFLAAYRTARRDWLQHKRCKFPAGTYWLGHHARAPVEKRALEQPRFLD